MLLPSSFARTITVATATLLPVVRAALDHILRALLVAQRALVLLIELPAVIIDPPRQRQPGQELQTVDLLLGLDPRPVAVRLELRVTDHAVLVGFPLQCTVDLGPLFAAHGALS